MSLRGRGEHMKEKNKLWVALAAAEGVLILSALGIASSWFDWTTPMYLVSLLLSFYTLLVIAKKRVAANNLLKGGSDE